MSQRSGVCGICQVYHSNLPRHFQECHALKNYVLECRYCFHHEVRGGPMKLHLKKQHPDEDWPLDLLLLQRSCPSFRFLGHCPKCTFKAAYEEHLKAHLAAIHEPPVRSARSKSAPPSPDRPKVSQASPSPPTSTSVPSLLGIPTKRPMIRGRVRPATTTYSSVAGRGLVQSRLVGLPLVFARRLPSCPLRLLHPLCLPAPAVSSAPSVPSTLSVPSAPSVSAPSTLAPTGATPAPANLAPTGATPTPATLAPTGATPLTEPLVRVSRTVSPPPSSIRPTQLVSPMDVSGGTRSKTYATQDKRPTTVMPRPASQHP